MTRCPFRLAGTPYNAVTDGGCHADGVTDDSGHFTAAIAAALAAGKRLFVPAGTYLWSTYPTFLSDLYLYGAGAGSTIIQMASGTNVNMIECQGIDGVTLRDLTLRQTEPAIEANTKVSGIQAIDCQNWNVRNVNLDNLRFGVRWPSGTPSAGWTLTNVIATANLMPLMVADLSYSSFTDCSFDTFSVASGNHGAYIERDCHYLTFTRCHFLRGGGYGLQLYYDGVDPNSNYNTFTDCHFDSSGSTSGNACITIAEGHDHATLTNSIFTARTGGESVRWYGGNDTIVIDGFTSTGGGALLGDGGSPGTSANSELKNGTYTAASLGPPPTGVTVTNVSHV